MKQKNLNKFYNCPRYNDCSASICPLDNEASIRIAGKEDFCPYRVNRKLKNQKGTRTLATGVILAVIPKSNIKMLNRRSQKRWLELKNLNNHGNNNTR